MRTYILIVIILFPITLIGNNFNINSEHFKAIEQIKNGYNTQDYKLLKKSLSLLGRMIVPKKMLRKEFEKYYNVHGNAEIIDITGNIKNAYTVQLKMDKTPLFRAFWQFNFNSNSKVIGFGFASPSLYYLKEPISQPSLTTDNLIDSLNRIVSKYEKKSPLYGFNGCILASIDSFVYVKSAGYSLLSKNYTNDIETQFHLASCTKPITSVAVSILVEKKLLRFSDLVADHIPEFPYKNVTVEHLLSHTSGIPDYQRYINKELKNEEFVNNDNILQLFIEHKIALNFEPDEMFQYSNTNYVFLAILVERVSNQQFSEFIQEEIFHPLNMERSRLYNTRRFKGEILENYAHGYVYSYAKKAYFIPDSLEEYSYVKKQDLIYGDDNVSSTVSDMNSFLKIFHKGQTFISDSLIDHMTTKHLLSNGEKVSYGAGIIIHEKEGHHKLLYHTGSWPGYYTMILTIPEKKLNLIILTNNQFSKYMQLADEVIYLLLQNK